MKQDLENKDKEISNLTSKVYTLKSDHVKELNLIKSQLKLLGIDYFTIYSKYRLILLHVELIGHKNWFILPFEETKRHNGKKEDTKKELSNQNGNYIFCHVLFSNLRVFQ